LNRLPDNPQFLGQSTKSLRPCLPNTTLLACLIDRTNDGRLHHLFDQSLHLERWLGKHIRVPEMKGEVYEAYGVTAYGSGEYEVDHLILLELLRLPV
jgi:hypothetical protein